LGIAYERLDHPKDARAAFLRAYELNPADADYQAATRYSDFSAGNKTDQK
jgi:Flp pilus assembly protein TadD